jgi:hypothetical protein
MGKVDTAINEKENAIKMFDKAIESQFQFLPSDHPDIS